MENFKKMLSYLLVLAIAFYALPLIGKDTGSFMLILLAVIPVICFIVSLIYGIKNSFSLAFPVITSVLFIPTIFIYYNSSAWVYIIGYAGIALTGNLIGRYFVKR